MLGSHHDSEFGSKWRAVQALLPDKLVVIKVVDSACLVAVVVIVVGIFYLPLSTALGLQSPVTCGPEQ